jgi:hypothetical protein
LVIAVSVVLEAPDPDIRQGHRRGDDRLAAHRIPNQFVWNVPTLYRMRSAGVKAVFGTIHIFLEAPFYKAGGREQRLPLGMAAL